jgi:hypothetical protein
VKYVIHKTAAYQNIIGICIAIHFNILKIHREIAVQTDNATTILRVSGSIFHQLIIAAFSAITYNAGSAIVVEKPIKNQKNIIQKYHFLFAKLSVSLFHIGKIPYCNHIRNTANHIHTIIIHIVVSSQLLGIECKITN